MRWGGSMCSAAEGKHIGLPIQWKIMHGQFSMSKGYSYLYGVIQTIQMATSQVGIIMGSESDLKVMSEAADVLREMGVAFELTVVSAHRTPERMTEYASKAASRGLKVVIAGAGGAAHLPGMVASLIKSSNSIDGWDSILSILQMPSGVPVATVALNGARNAGILAAQILATSDPALAKKLQAYKDHLREKVENSIREIKIAGYENGFDQ